MRKKTVKFVADTIFWYILYFLPIVSYLLFCFSEPISYLTVADNTVTESTEIVQVIEETESEYVIDAGEYEFREILTDFSSESIFDSHFSFPVLFLGEQYSYIHFDRYENYYGQYSFLSGWSDSTGPVPPVQGFYDCLSSSWLVSARNFTVLSDISTSADLYDWFMSNIVVPEPEPEPEPEQSTLRVVSFTNYITSAFSFLEDNIFYTSLDGAIGADGLCPLISDKGLLLYLSWFVSVYIAHLFVDFVLFIPRLAHKWLNAFTQGD